jgi:hypothetical protein
MIVKQVDVIDSSARVTAEALKGDALCFFGEAYRGLGRRNAKAMSCLLN